MGNKAGLANRFIVVKDNFYDDIGNVIETARRFKYSTFDDYTGYHSLTVYHPRGIVAKLERILGVPITRWDKDPAEGNGVFYLGLSRGRNRETPGIHWDEPEDDVTVLIYLTEGLPEEFGTSLWRHKRTGLTFAPTRSDCHRIGKPIGKVRTLLEADSTNREKWVETDRVGYRFNRMVAYPSGMLHSASKHYGATLKDGRLYQTYRVAVNWKKSRLAG
jgi:hypothetical protein